MGVFVFPGKTEMRKCVELKSEEIGELVNKVNFNRFRLPSHHVGKSPISIFPGRRTNRSNPKKHLLMSSVTIVSSNGDIHEAGLGVRDLCSEGRARIQTQLWAWPLISCEIAVSRLCDVRDPYQR